MLNNFLSLIFKGLRYRPIRSWLTILGIVIGVMLMVLILSIGTGIQNAIGDMLQMFGSDLIMVLPGKETNPFMGVAAGQRFREKDALDLEKIDGVRMVVPVNIGSLNADFKGEMQGIFLRAAPLGKLSAVLQESQGMTLSKGDWPVDSEIDRIVIGYSAANSLFRNKIKVGDEIIIQSKRFKVSGIVAKLGQQDADNAAFMSLIAFNQISGLKPGVANIMIKIKPGYNPTFVGERIKSELQKQEAVRDFTVLSPDKVAALTGSILAAIEFIFIILAFISLLVGAVGIMNTMYTSVLERVKQIGIMKAVGASNSMILGLFLLESGFIGLIGGIAGIILGIGGAAVIGFMAYSLGIKGMFSLGTLDYLGFLTVLVLTFVIGVVAGALPAKQASRLEPAEALRRD